MEKYNKEIINRVYPRIEDLKKLISNTESEIYQAEQYKTNDSKAKVKRLNEFLSFLQGLKNEIKNLNVVNVVGKLLLKKMKKGEIYK